MKNSAWILGTEAGKIIAERFSERKHAVIMEYFSKRPLPAGWTLSDSLGIWYCLGHLCMLSSVYLMEREVSTEIAAELLDSGLHGLLTTWKMPEDVHRRFSAFNSTKLKDAATLWLSMITVLGNPDEATKYVIAKEKPEQCCLMEVVSRTPVLIKLYTFFSLFVTELISGKATFSVAIADVLAALIGNEQPFFPIYLSLSDWFLSTERLHMDFILSQRSLIVMNN